MNHISITYAQLHGVGMSKKNEKPKPEFDAVKLLKKAVKKALNRKRALGQYAVISQDGEIKKIQF